MHIPYVGSGPYCYANAFAMMFGERAPATSVIEFATGSPFGMQLIGGALPFFDPYGWDPEAGFDAALDALGWASDISRAVDDADAIAGLSAALTEGPVWIGPVEMGHLRHQPGMHGPIGADHYVVVLAIDERRVLMHDPQGYPYAELPIGDFMNAWRAETVDYGKPFTMRTRFRQVETVSEEETITRSIPHGISWLSMETPADAPGGSLGNGEAAIALAQAIAAGCAEPLRQHLIHFAVRVGARRANDAAWCLNRVGHVDAARIAAGQARVSTQLGFPLAQSCGSRLLNRGGLDAEATLLAGRRGLGADRALASAWAARRA